MTRENFIIDLAQPLHQIPPFELEAPLIEQPRETYQYPRYNIAYCVLGALSALSASVSLYSTFSADSNDFSAERTTYAVISGVSTVASAIFCGLFYSSCKRDM